MRCAILLTALMVATISASADTPAAAADLVRHRHAAPVTHALPFPRGALAQSVWASNAYLNECGAYTAWTLAGCFSRDSQGRCLKHADASDRACQRACRLYGGPYLPIE